MVKQVDFIPKIKGKKEARPIKAYKFEVSDPSTGDIVKVIMPMIRQLVRRSNTIAAPPRAALIPAEITTHSMASETA